MITCLEPIAALPQPPAEPSALAANGGRRTQTARGLGITREGLYKKMKRLNVE